MKVTVRVRGNEHAAVTVNAPEELSPSKRTLLASANLSLAVMEKLFGEPLDMTGGVSINFSPEPSGELEKIIATSNLAEREVTIRLPEKYRLNALGENTHSAAIQTAAVAAALLEAKSRVINDLTDETSAAILTQANTLVRDILEKIVSGIAPGVSPDEALGPNDLFPTMTGYTHPLFSQKR